MRNRRIISISILIICAFLGIIARLHQIQLSTNHTFSQERAVLINKAFAAQSREILLQSGRGKILDRYGHVFVGQDLDRLLLFPQTKQQIDLKKERFAKLAKIINYPEAGLRRLLGRIDYPLVLTLPSGSELVLNSDQKRKIAALKLPSIMIARTDNRTASPRLAQQILGRIVRNPFLIQEKYSDEYRSGIYSAQSRIGYSGLEASFERFLHGSGEKVLGYLQTRKGQPLSGAKSKIFAHQERVKNHPIHLVTTLDAELQQGVEQLLRTRQVQDGAIVVQDIASGDILAMGSAPFVKASDEPTDQPWEHRALMEATPGSIFKTIVAVAALEEKKVSLDTPFYCRGELGRYKMRDAVKKGHGSETFLTAFAQSCNVIMAKTSKRVTGEKLEQYARRFGIGQQILWSGRVGKQAHFAQMPSEQTGLIFSVGQSKKDDGAVMQTGIGQRDVKMTPLQAANMVTALFHQGKALSPRLVTELQDEKGNRRFLFARKYLNTAKPLHASTCHWVKRMMQLVVRKGTASGLKNHHWVLAGKTGTAQVGVDKRHFNKWMIGYGPVDKPRYSVSVLLREVDTANDPRSQQLFAKTMDILKNLEEQRAK